MWLILEVWWYLELTVSKFSRAENERDGALRTVEDLQISIQAYQVKTRDKMKKVRLRIWYDINFIWWGISPMIFTSQAVWNENCPRVTKNINIQCNSYITYILFVSCSLTIWWWVQSSVIHIDSWRCSVLCLCTVTYWFLGGAAVILNQ